MTLERYQAGDNARASMTANVTASNDPKQLKHDANEQLIKGAELAAAGNALGLSEEETLAAVSREYRRQKRKDDATTKSDVLRSMAQAANTVRGDTGTAEVPGVGYKSVDDEAFAFGEDVDYNSQYGSTRADDEQTYRADDRGFTEDPETGLVRRENFSETRGDFETVAPLSSVRDALSRLEATKQKDAGLGGLLARAFGGSAPVDTEINTAEDALRRHITPEAPSDARMGRALVRQDNARFSPAVMEANDWRADAEAQAIARDGYTFNGPGAMADEAIGRIAEIRSLGKIGETAHVIRTADDAIKGQATRRHDGVYLDPTTGNPIATQGPELPPALAGDRTPNNGSSSDALNAPQTAREWVTSSVPEYRENGRTFGDYPQVDITQETTNFANKVRNLGQQLNLSSLSGVSSNIRSIDELQRVAQIVADGVAQQQGGGTLMMRNPETGRSVPAGDNIIPGLMHQLRMSSGDEQRLANALYQIDAANRSSVNQNPTGTYLSRSQRGPGLEKGIVFDAPEAMGDFGGTEVARQKKGSSIRVGTTDQGKPIKQDIVAAMAGLDSPGAQRPFIGMPAERPSKDSTSTFQQDPVYNKSGETSQEGIARAIREQAERRAKGKPIDEVRTQQNIVGAQAVQRRADEDTARRADQMSTIIASMPPSMRRSSIRRY